MDKGWDEDDGTCRKNGQIGDQGGARDGRLDEGDSPTIRSGVSAAANPARVSNNVTERTLRVYMDRRGMMESSHAAGYGNKLPVRLNTSL